MTRGTMSSGKGRSSPAKSKVTPRSRKVRAIESARAVTSASESSRSAPATCP